MPSLLFRLKNYLINPLSPRQNGRHFRDDIFKCIFFCESIWISIKTSLKFVPEGPINNIPSLVQIMAWRRPGDKPLSKPMAVELSTHICVTRPQPTSITHTLLAKGKHCRLKNKSKLQFYWFCIYVNKCPNLFAKPEPKIRFDREMLWLSDGWLPRSSNHTSTCMVGIEPEQASQTSVFSFCAHNRKGALSVRFERA